MINGWYILNSETDPSEDVPLDYFIYSGTDKYFDITTEDFMIEVWFRGEPAYGTYGLMSKRNVSTLMGWQIKAYPNTKLVLEMESDNPGISGSAVTSNLNFYDNEWHYLVVIFDRSANFKIYLDNSVVADADMTTHEGYSFANTGSLIIGNTCALTEAWIGDLTAPRIYNFGNDGLPSNIADIVKYNYMHPGEIHEDAMEFLLDGWDWHETPSMIGRNHKKLTKISTPIYADGGKVYDLQRLLTYQFRNSTNLKSLIEIFAEQGIVLSDAIRDVQFLRTLSLVEGVQLDGLGQLCGERRNGRNDSNYRDALYFKILINASKATASDVIAAARIATNGNKITLLEKFPAKFSIVTDGKKVLSNLREILEGVSAIAVGLDSVISSFGNSPIFYYATEYGAQLGSGFSEIDTSTGEYLYKGGKLAEQIA